MAAVDGAPKSQLFLSRYEQIDWRQEELERWSCGTVLLGMQEVPHVHLADPGLVPWGAGVQTSEVQDHVHHLGADEDRKEQGNC